MVYDRHTAAKKKKTLALSTTICVCVPVREVDVTDDDRLVHK